MGEQLPALQPRPRRSLTPSAWRSPPVPAPAENKEEVATPPPAERDAGTAAAPAASTHAAAAAAAATAACAATAAAQTAAARRFAVGDRVRCRDTPPDGRWKYGVVTEVGGDGGASVQPDGWLKSYRWEEVSPVRVPPPSPRPDPAAVAEATAHAAAAAAVLAAAASEGLLPEFGSWVSDVCPVCFDELRRDRIEHTECGHTFCSACLARVRAERPLCPLCRHRIGPDPAPGEEPMSELIEALLLLMLTSQPPARAAGVRWPVLVSLASAASASSRARQQAEAGGGASAGSTAGGSYRVIRLGTVLDAISTFAADIDAY